MQRWRQAMVRLAGSDRLRSWGERAPGARLRRMPSTVAAHEVSSPRTSLASPRSCRLFDLSVLRPLAVAASRG